MSALVSVDTALDDLYDADRLLNAAVLASFGLKCEDGDSVAGVIEIARDSVKSAVAKLAEAIGHIRQDAGVTP